MSVLILMAFAMAFFLCYCAFVLLLVFLGIAGKLLIVAIPVIAIWAIIRCFAGSPLHARACAKTGAEYSAIDGRSKINRFDQRLADIERRLAGLE
ncbi:MAG: hypothetical protein AMXMBFR84_32050 [Candidatus Hydrogenedentota bacterium]